MGCEEILPALGGPNFKSDDKVVTSHTGDAFYGSVGNKDGVTAGQCSWEGTFMSLCEALSIGSASPEQYLFSR